MARKRFYRHFKSTAPPLYWLLFAYLIGGWLFPIVGWALLFFIIGTILTAFWRGRWWCGNICPRSNMFLKLLSKYSPHRKIPSFVRTIWFRLLVICLIFIPFGVQFYNAWGNWGAMGTIFWRTLFITTIIGVILSFIYAPMTWCSFCPIGSIAAWVSPRKEPLPGSFTRVRVSNTCIECKSCARACPMQLKPYESKGTAVGYLHPDCIKCGNCMRACKAATQMENIKIDSESSGTF